MDSHHVARGLLVLCLLCLPLAAAADDAAAAQERTPKRADTSRGIFYLRGGIYAHYQHDNEFDGPPVLVSGEYYRNKYVLGISLFNNSFGQFSQFYFGGRQWNPFRKKPNLNVKLAVGVVSGYRGEHYDVLPVRWGDRYGLGVVPSVGWKKGRTGYEVSVLGVGGLLFSIGRDLN